MRFLIHDDWNCDDNDDEEINKGEEAKIMMGIVGAKEHG